MAKNNHIANSFIAGEVSPRFYGRTETQQYNGACETLLNSLVYPQGGSARRAGTRVITRVQDTSGNNPVQVRCFPFKGSDGTKWQLIITSDPPDMSQTQTADQPSNWKVVNCVTEEVIALRGIVTDRSAHPIYNGIIDFETFEVDLNTAQFAQSGDIMIITSGDIPPLCIVYDKNATNTGTNYKFLMSVFGEYDDSIIRYFSGVNFDTYAFAMPFGPVQSYSASNVLGLTVSNLGPNGFTITAGSAITFTSDWVGRYIKISDAGLAKSLILYVHTYVSATTLYANLTGLGGTLTTPGGNIYGGTNTDRVYEIGQWDRIQGYPRAVCFFEGRLIFGGSKAYPDTGWASEVNDILDFDVVGVREDPTFADPVVTSDPFSFTLKGNLVSELRWLFDSKTIVCGTDQREYVLKGPDTSKTLGPDNFSSSPETPHGSAPNQAIRVGNTTAFLQRDRRTFRELVYSNDEDSFKAADVNIIGEHIAKRGSTEKEGEFRQRVRGAFAGFAMQQVPFGILWVSDNNGFLCGLTRERDYDVAAWHRHQLGGVSKILKDGVEMTFSPFVQSVSTIQRAKNSNYDEGPTGEPDELWLTVARGYKADADTDYANTPAIYIEKMCDEWEAPNIDQDWDLTVTPPRAPVYMDMSVVVTREDYPSGVITDLPHSHGETVGVVVNGIWFGTYTVNEGSIDISQKIADYLLTEWDAIIGFNYEADIIPVTPEVPAQTGSSMGRPKRIDQITIHFVKSMGVKFGAAIDVNQDDTPTDPLEVIDFARPSQSATAAIPLFTGDKKLDFPAEYETRPRVHIKSYLPFPTQVTHVVYRMVAYEG